MNSFVSTSLSSTVAMMYLGTDPDRDVILEILIDKTLLDTESLPFANIQAFSAFPDEQEVLLSMGITLQVQSMTIGSQNKNMHIQVRLCYEEDAGIKELKTFFLQRKLRYGQDESFYMSFLANLLYFMGDQEKFEQLAKLLKPSNKNTEFEACRDMIQYINMSKYSIDGNRHDILRRLSDLFLNAAESCQALAHDSCTSNCQRDQLLSIANRFSSCSLRQNPGEIIDNPKRLIDLMSLFPLFEKLMYSLSVPSSHPAWSLIQLANGLEKLMQGNHVEALKVFETGFTSSSASFLDENSPSRQCAMQLMADAAAAVSDDNRSLQILEDLHTSGKSQVGALIELGEHYERVGDLPMAIGYYRSVIDDCNLPPNSIVIVNAYYTIGTVFFKLDDYDLALSNYYRARELLLQHHPCTHPLLTDLQKIISLTERQQRLQKLEKQLSDII
jgi:tetratricopeptide (TPR) repeat protein